jgi:hypothetical protein
LEAIAFIAATMHFIYSRLYYWLELTPFSWILLNWVCSSCRATNPQASHERLIARPYSVNAHSLNPWFFPTSYIIKWHKEEHSTCTTRRCWVVADRLVTEHSSHQSLG